MAESHLNLAVSTSSYLLKYLNIFPLGSVSIGDKFFKYADGSIS